MMFPVSRIAEVTCNTTDSDHLSILEVPVEINLSYESTTFQHLANTLSGNPHIEYIAQTTFPRCTRVLAQAPHHSAPCPPTHLQHGVSSNFHGSASGVACGSIRSGLQAQPRQRHCVFAPAMRHITGTRVLSGGPQKTKNIMLAPLQHYMGQIEPLLLSSIHSAFSSGAFISV